MSQKNVVAFARVSLFVAAPTPEHAVRLIQRGSSLLSRDELARADRFVGDADRRAYLLAHILLRTALSQRAPQVPPAAWELAPGAHGKPELVGPTTAPRLQFNLSHADGLVACAVSDGGLVGVDVEATDDPGDLDELAERHFAPLERAELSALPSDDRRDRFYALWTLKEAFVKARGLGLGLPLDSFAFHFLPDQPPRIGFASQTMEELGRWHFVQRRPTPRHRLALAIGNGDRISARLVDEWVLEDVDTSGVALLQAVDGAEASENYETFEQN